MKFYLKNVIENISKGYSSLNNFYLELSFLYEYYKMQCNNEEVQGEVLFTYYFWKNCSFLFFFYVNIYYIEMKDILGTETKRNHSKMIGHYTNNQTVIVIYNLGHI